VSYFEFLTPGPSQGQQYHFGNLLFDRVMSITKTGLHGIPNCRCGIVQKCLAELGGCGQFTFKKLSGNDKSKAFGLQDETNWGGRISGQQP
jgi:hypothetical protein